MNPFSTEFLTIAQIATWLLLLLGAISHKWVLDKIGLVTKKELAEHQSDLSAKNKYDEILLAKLREEQSPIFKELFAKVTACYDSVMSFIFAKPSSSNFSSKVDAFYATKIDMSDYYYKNRIYLTTDLCKHIDSFLLAMMGAYALGKNFKADADYINTDKGAEEWRYVTEWGLKTGGKMKDKIETELRSMMGV